MSALISKGLQNKRGLDVPLLLGVELKDAQEEMFVILVCDGLPLGLAFKRAGFTSSHNNAPSNLFNLPRVQERAAAILEARRTQGVVTLPEVTDMLKRVFAGAHSEGEYSAAHNAAFSLARLYGHVTDRQTIEVMRRPSRDPDAPSEQMLEDWAASLPLVGSSAADQASNAALQGPPADLLGPGPSMLSADNIGSGPWSQPLPTDATHGSTSNDINDLERGTSSLLDMGSAAAGARQGPPASLLGPGPQDGPLNLKMSDTHIGPQGSGPEGPGPQLDLFNDINGLAGPDDGSGGTGNGAPPRPVTGTPNQCGGPNLLGERVPVKIWPKIEDLF